MKIALIPNYHKQEILNATNEVAKILCENGHEVYVHEKIKMHIENAKTFSSHKKIGVICDFFIAIGGDGTIIHASKHSNGKPILGVNMGRLGYMAGLEYSEIDSIIDIISGNCVYEERMLIDIKSGEKTLGTVLNDGVISAKLSKLLDYIVSIDDSDFHYRADGLIISTPTGSTAYSLSAGGPVVDPDSRCMVFTPICPHSLFNRSLILSPDTKIRVRVNLKYDETVILTMDGEKPYTLRDNEEIAFEVSRKKVKLVLKNKRNFFKLVNQKLLIEDYKYGG